MAAAGPARSARRLAAAGEPRRDPVEMLIEQGKNRIEELLPVRYARMQTDPFTFLRGAAAMMAADLATLPATGLRVQSCGDCHLANFGAYASPEGTPVFDINDFDETLPAPFEWDVKRLATSLAVAGRVAQMPDTDCRRLARLAARNYRRHIARLARLPPLDAWGTRVDLAAAIADLDSAKIRRNLEKRLAAILKSDKAHFGLVEKYAGGWRIKDKPPLVHHLSRHELHARKAFASYAETLQEDRRVLLRRYHLHDVAFKVVGIGSVGTFCAIGLLISDDEAPLLLQIKEAQESVLAPYAGASDYPNHGQRVVVGQRMLQAATDIFLGWTEDLVNCDISTSGGSRITVSPMSGPVLKRLCRFTPGYAAAPLRALMPAPAMRQRYRRISATETNSTKRSRHSRWLTPTRANETGALFSTRLRQDGLPRRSPDQAPKSGSPVMCRSGGCRGRRSCGRISSCRHHA